VPTHASAPRSRRSFALVRCWQLALAAVAASAGPAAGQTLDDGMMVPHRQLLTTVEYTHDWWDRYWEGDLKRGNENIGTLTTRSVTWTAAYGVTERVSVFATLPHVWTRASQGVLHEMGGWQDLTLGAKVQLLRTTVGERTTLGASALVGVGTPTTDYTPDFQPLSIGLGSRRALARGALHLQGRAGWFADGSVGHTWRSTVRLDRDAYYTDGRLVLSDEVAMPDVFDYGVTVGYQRARLAFPLTLTGQRTLGGGDIRRNDMPFVSNRMDFTRLHARVMYALPRLNGVSVQVGAMRTLVGRNVGESTSLSGGLTSAFRL
jgi:hypothetical protein